MSVSNDGTRRAIDIITFTGDPENREATHSTAKPVDLLKYLILTYTNKDELVLDNTMGSGSTGVACIQTARRFIGIEKDDRYFELAKERIEREESQLNMFDLM